MTKYPDSVAIVSGGMDSVTLLHYVVKKMDRSPAVLTFNYGQKHAKETGFAAEQARVLDLPITELDLSFFGAMVSGVSSLIQGSMQVVPDLEEVLGDPQPNTYVPNRNMILLSVAAGFAEAIQVPEVYIGVQRHDVYGYWDTTMEFINRINNVLSLNRKSFVAFRAPFVDFSKTQELEIGLRLGINYADTWSCYRGLEKACGTCPTCVERLKAFADCGIADPLPYYTPQELRSLGLA